MVVLFVEKVKPSLRGELTRWMIQPQAGVFVGRLSARVRDLLWEKVRKKAPMGRALMIYSAKTEQGFAVRASGERRRQVVDMEGLYLVKLVTESSG